MTEIYWKCMVLLQLSLLFQHKPCFCIFVNIPTSPVKQYFNIHGWIRWAKKKIKFLIWFFLCSSTSFHRKCILIEDGSFWIRGRIEVNWGMQYFIFTELTLSLYNLTPFVDTVLVLLYSNLQGSQSPCDSAPSHVPSSPSFATWLFLYT